MLLLAMQLIKQELQQITTLNEGKAMEMLKYYQIALFSALKNMEL